MKPSDGVCNSVHSGLGYVTNHVTKNVGASHWIRGFLIRLRQD